MDTEFRSPQRIARLTPLADVLAIIAQVRPVGPRQVAVADALGLTLAADVVAEFALPKSATALRDGFAVRADETADANTYAPIPFANEPVRIDAGEKLPPGTDAVAPLDAFVVTGGTAQAIAPVTAGDGVLPNGTDASRTKRFCEAGRRLGVSDIAALSASQIKMVTIREPRIAIVRASVNEKTKITATLIGTATSKVGSRIVSHESLDQALKQDAYDAIFCIGGTGSGRDDRALEFLATTGQLSAHGIGLMPGETSAFGFIGERPVLMLPGRIDAALSAWLTIGRPLMARLCGSESEDAPFKGMLTRKIASTIGIVDVVLVRRDGEKVEPLAGGYWPMQAIAQADGFIVVPAPNEGYPESATVAVRPLP